MFAFIRNFSSINYFQRTCVGCLNYWTTCVRHFKKLGLTWKNHQLVRAYLQIVKSWYVFYAMQGETFYGLLNHQTSGANLLKSSGWRGRSVILLGISPDYRVNDMFSVPSKVTHGHLNHQTTRAKNFKSLGWRRRNINLVGIDTTLQIMEFVLCFPRHI